MTDSEFILWYINKNYLFTGLKFKYKYSIKDDFTISQLYRNVLDAIPIDMVEGKPLYDFIFNWYSIKLNDSKMDVFDFLKFKYKVTLGQTSWVITKMSGQPVTIDDIIVMLNKNYDDEFLKSTIGEWYENEMIKITEQSMLHFK